MKAASTKDLLKYDQSPYLSALFTLIVCHLISGTGQTIPETRLVKRLGGDVMVVGRSFHLAYPRPFLGSQTPIENLPTAKLLPNPWHTGLWCGVTAKVALSSGQHQVTFSLLQSLREHAPHPSKRREPLALRNITVSTSAKSPSRLGPGVKGKVGSHSSTKE